MTKGLWVWPADSRGQRRMLRRVAASKQLTNALALVAKSKEGLSNSELDDLLNDSSEWLTLWVIRQLISLGFIESKVDLFGNPVRYRMTELGRNALSAITGQPPVKPPSPASQTPQPVAPKTQ
ncbi:MAG TPA: hypothetical protein VLU91_08565 [Nitrososphaerales archaeon]|nr:hypothetical protein [Nitrososphaerales archaeon]